MKRAWKGCVGLRGEAGTALGPKPALVGISSNPLKWQERPLDFAGSGRTLPTSKIRNRSFSGENQLFKLVVNSSAIADICCLPSQPCFPQPVKVPDPFGLHVSVSINQSAGASDRLDLSRWEFEDTACWFILVQTQMVTHSFCIVKCILYA
jgi:hypothetical protein